MSTTTTSASASSGTVTTTLTIGNTAATRPQTLVLQLNRKPKKKVSWMPGTVDNEFMQKKSSKKCCIFHKEKPFDEDDSDDDQDHHNHCHDHNPDAASCSSSKPSD